MASDEETNGGVAGKDGRGEYKYSSTREEMNNPKADVNKNETADLKKFKALELYSKGYTQDEIAQEMGISQPTVSRYVKERSDIARQSRMGYVEQQMSEHEITIMSQNRVLKGLWAMADDPSIPSSERLRAYSLILQCNTKKTQAHSIARSLSQWRDAEEKEMQRREDALLTDGERFIRDLGGYPRSTHKEQKTNSKKDISDFMAGM